MECTAELDENEINLAQMWSLFCLWGFETSLQSFKFPCNLEMKEISKCACVPCQWPSFPYPGAVNRTADINNHVENQCVWELHQNASWENTLHKWKQENVPIFVCFRLPTRLVTMTWPREFSHQFGIPLLLLHFRMNNPLFA